MSLLARGAVSGMVVFSVLGLARWNAAGDREQTRPPARWFMPGARGVEPGGSLPVSKETGYLTRAFSGLRDEQARTWGQRNGLTEALAFSHNLTTVFPPELYDQHPEFFPLEGNARLKPPAGSYFWNPDIARPDVAAYAAAAARRHFERRPDAVSFALGVNDALIWGESPELLALATPVRWFRERPDYSPVVFTFMNRVATDLARTHPDKYVGALAYYWAEQVPPFSVHPRVIPFYTADRSQGYDRDFWCEELEVQQSWGKLAGRGTAEGRAEQRRAGIYDYVYGGGFLVPRVHTRLIAEHLQHAHRAGFTDYYAEVNPNWGLDGPMPWLVAQLVRDPRQTREALLAEYYGRYFQEAAAPMGAFFERCEEIWMGQSGASYWLRHYRNESQAGLFPAAVCAELRGILRTAQQAARSARVKSRVQLVSDTFGVTERLVAFHAAREKLFRAVARAKDSAAITSALVELVGRRREFVEYTNALCAREPVALHPVVWRDYLKNDPVPAALMSLRDAGVRELPVLDDPEGEALRRKLSDWERGAGKELMSNADLGGPLLPARRIAGLTYGVALPSGWLSRVEPAQFHRAELVEANGQRTLRVEGTKDSHVWQWVALPNRGWYEAEILVRGQASRGASVSLVAAFLDASHRHLMLKTHRLPEGEWPDWVMLRQAITPPPNAAWVGLGLRVQYQERGDWVEARGFTLKAATR